MCYIRQWLKLYPLMCYTGRCRWWGAFAVWRWGFRCEGFCQHPGDFHTCLGAGRKNKFSWQLRMLLSFPSSPGEWAPSPPLLQAAGWAKVALSHPISWCRAKTQLRPVLTGAVSPLSSRERRSPLVTVTPPACHAAASQAQTVFFLQSPLGPGSNLEASAPNHPGLQELKKKKNQLEAQGPASTNPFNPNPGCCPFPKGKGTVPAGWFLCAPAPPPLLSLNIFIFAPEVVPGDLLMLLKKRCAWPWSLKSAAETWGLVPTSAPTHTQRGFQRTMDAKGGANKSECVIVPIRVCMPATGSSTACLPSHLVLCTTETTLRALVVSAPNMDQGVCSPMLAWPPLCWQFSVEIVLSGTAEKSEYF